VGVKAVTVEYAPELYTMVALVPGRGVIKLEGEGTNELRIGRVTSYNRGRKTSCDTDAGDPVV
jgi:hypothetical protein